MKEGAMLYATNSHIPAALRRRILSKRTPVIAQVSTSVNSSSQFHEITLIIAFAKQASLKGTKCSMRYPPVEQMVELIVYLRVILSICFSWSDNFSVAY